MARSKVVGLGLNFYWVPASSAYGPKGEAFFICTFLISAFTSSASWIVLGAALVSCLVAKPECKHSLAMSFLTCEMLYGMDEMSYPSVFCFSFWQVERGDKEIA